MLRIRLQRKGRKKRPIWHIVVADSRSPRDGRIIEQLGRYDNVTEKKEVILNEDRVFYWLDNGAQPSDSVRKILRSEGLLYKRHLIGWGKSEEEIEAALNEWKSYRESKDSSETSRKAQYQSILDAEEKEYKKQVQEKSKQAAAEVEAEKAQEEAAADTETAEETETTAEQGDTSATVEKEATAENKAAKAAESQTEDETVQAKEAEEIPAEKAAAESDQEPVAADTDTADVEEQEEEGATAEEAAQEVAELADEPAPDTASAKGEAEEPAAEEETKEEETKDAGESTGKVSTDMTAKEAIDHINENSLADLKGFVTGDEERVTVQRAWESKQEEG